MTARRPMWADPQQQQTRVMLPLALGAECAGVLDEVEVAAPRVLVHAAVAKLARAQLVVLAREPLGRGGGCWKVLLPKSMSVEWARTTQHRLWAVSDKDITAARERDNHVLGDPTLRDAVFRFIWRRELDQFD